MATIRLPVRRIATVIYTGKPKCLCNAAVSIGQCNTKAKCFRT